MVIIIENSDTENNWDVNPPPKKSGKGEEPKIWPPVSAPVRHKLKKWGDFKQKFLISTFAQNKGQLAPHAPSPRYFFSGSNLSETLNEETKEILGGVEWNQHLPVRRKGAKKKNKNEGITQQCFQLPAQLGLLLVFSATFSEFLFHSVSLCPLKTMETPHFLYRDRKNHSRKHRNVTKLIRYQCTVIFFTQLSQLQPNPDFYLQLKHVQKILLWLKAACKPQTLYSFNPPESLEDSPSAAAPLKNSEFAFFAEFQLGAAKEFFISH